MANVLFNRRVFALEGAVARQVRHFGGLALLSRDVFREVWRRPFEGRIILAQLDHQGVMSLSIATITALFTGMVLALQVGHSLSSYGAKVFIGEIVSLALIRELGPVLTSLMVGGRIGAGITAEIGTMVVTEQVDAIRALASDPIRKLVVPKVIAALVMFPVLTLLADTVGVAGGMIIAKIEFDISPSYYVTHVLQAVGFRDIASGIGKTFFFGYFVALIGCYNGFGATGGADGVGRATTNTVVGCSIAILISDFFLTKFFIIMGG
jgi:phospholipid/cholesterol/gamma-HCH transport system permease protein